MRCDPSAERGAVLIILPRYKRLHLLKLCFTHTCHLTDLVNPVALQLLRCRLVVHVGKRQAVGEPRHAEFGDQRGFPDALISVEHCDVVEFDAGMIDTHICRAKCLSGHSADVGVVLRPQIINQDGVHSRHLVPHRQTVEILLDRMVGAVICGLGHGNVIISL